MANPQHREVRAGIVVTGTEVLSARIVDRNGPWLSERMREHGVELTQIVVVGDRGDDVRAALEFLVAQGADLIVTSGGMGPTADDLTAQVVAQFAGTTLTLDAELEQRIRAISLREREGRTGWDREAMLAGTRKQALVPHGATVLEPVGTAPGFVVPPPADAARPTVLVLPGPPREVRAMWDAALHTLPMRLVLDRAGSYERRVMRLLGLESELAQSLRAIEATGIALEQLDITTCWHGAELEITTVFRPDDADVYAALQTGVLARHGEHVFSLDGATVDEIVTRALAGRTIAVTDAGTGGQMAARLTDRADAATLRGGITASTREAINALVNVPADLIDRYGTSSPEVAAAMAAGSISLFDADTGIGITPIEGAAAGTIGHVGVAVATHTGHAIERTLRLPDHHAAARELITTEAMHLLRRLLQEQGDGTTCQPL